MHPTSGKNIILVYLFQKNQLNDLNVKYNKYMKEKHARGHS